MIFLSSLSFLLPLSLSFLPPSPPSLPSLLFLSPPSLSLSPVIPLSPLPLHHCITLYTPPWPLGHSSSCRPGYSPLVCFSSPYPLIQTQVLPGPGAQRAASPPQLPKCHLPFHLPWVSPAVRASLALSRALPCCSLGILKSPHPPGLGGVSS